METKNEIWKDVPGYLGQFQASNLGRVRSLRILRPAISQGTGYLRVGCKKKAVHVHTLVAAAFHGERPIGLHVNHIDGSRTNNRPENLEYVTPRENLLHAFRIGQRKQSLSDKVMDRIAGMYFDEGLSTPDIAKRLNVKYKQVRSVIEVWRAHYRRGKRAPWEQKLTLDKARQIRQLWSDGKLTMVEIGRAFGVHPAHVSRICSGKLWREDGKRSPHYKAGKWGAKQWPSEPHHAAEAEALAEPVQVEDDISF